MPRANRYILPGHLYHITHRCHDRCFLLQFAQDRTCYRNWMREAAARFHVSVLGYCLTRNHIHLILCSHELEDISRFMHLVQGPSAQQYNRRKDRLGAYWEDRYSCTMVGSGGYLWNCLLYVDMNMVRAGAVKHPDEWEWGGYREFMGLRRRYTIVDVPTLVTMMGFVDIEKARERYRLELERKIAEGRFERNPVWTETIAVGNRSFVEGIKERTSRVNTCMAEEATPEGLRLWSVREAEVPYV